MVPPAVAEAADQPVSEMEIKLSGLGCVLSSNVRVTMLWHLLVLYTEDKK